MTKKRMRAKDNDGFFATADMARRFSQRLLDLQAPRTTLLDVLVEIMNGDSIRGENRERVVRVFQLLQIRSEYNSQLRTRHGVLDSQLGDSMISLLVGFCDELNEMLRRYEVVPQIDPIFKTPAISYLSPESGRKSAKNDAETAAVMCLLQLAAQEDFDRLRMCRCEQFFSAGRTDQWFCSAACRVKDHQSSEEFKSKRRVSDRERYRLQRDGKVKQPKRRKNVPKKAR